MGAIEIAKADLDTALSFVSSNSDIAEQIRADISKLT
jgi:hypothetical protein